MSEHIAYVAIVEPDGFGVGIASANQTGYTPYAHGYDSMERAEAAAQEMNKAAGIDALEARAVKVCSMFRPGEYEEVINHL